MAYDGVLLIAFGGPTPGGCARIRENGEPCPGPEHGNPCPEGSPDEAHCFVQGILGKTPARAARTNDVAGHYRHLGGYSPFNELTFRQARSLEIALRKRGVPLPVRAGMRHWGPSIRDVMRALAAEGHRKLLATIMAPHQSKVSWDWYLSTVAEACGEIPETRRPAVDVIEPWGTHPAFTEAIASLVRADIGRLPLDRGRDAHVVFTAHAIPVAIAKSGPYCRQFEETASLVARSLGLPRFTTAYQSSAPDSSGSWTGPDINDALRDLKAEGVRDVIVSPIGFLVDHVEVLYDLDVEARKTAETLDLGFCRSGTVGSHPTFIGMLADLLAERAQRQRG